MGDEFLSGLVMRGQVTDNLDLDYRGNRIFRLLLTSERTGSIPLVSEDDASWDLTEELQAAISVAAQELINPLQDLRQAWQPAVLSTFGSADAEGELLMQTQGPLRLLNAYTEEDRRAFYPSTYRLALPVLSAASLQAMAEPLALVSRQLGAVWSRVVSLAHESYPASDMMPGRWLRFYSRCVGEMTSFWLEQQLLPSVVPFQPDQRARWFGRRRQTQTEQQPPCGLCFWRDVEGMWQLGQSLAQSHIVMGKT